MPRLDRMRAKHLLGSLSFRIASLRSFLSREIRKEEEGGGGDEKFASRDFLFLFENRKSNDWLAEDRKEGRGKKLPAINEVYVSSLPLVAPSFDPAAGGPSPIPGRRRQAGTDATHLRRVLRNLCGRLAVGQHSQRIKIPCRTCGLSLNCRAFPSSTIAANRTDDSPIEKPTPPSLYEEKERKEQAVRSQRRETSASREMDREIAYEKSEG